MVKVRETTRECRRTSKNSEKGEHMATLLLFFLAAASLWLRIERVYVPPHITLDMQAF